jgi:hypothetical protein
MIIAVSAALTGCGRDTGQKSVEDTIASYVKAVNGGDLVRMTELMDPEMTSEILPLLKEFRKSNREMYDMASEMLKDIKLSVEIKSMVLNYDTAFVDVGVSYYIDGREIAGDDVFVMFYFEEKWYIVDAGMADFTGVSLFQE